MVPANPLFQLERVCFAIQLSSIQGNPPLTSELPTPHKMTDLILF